MSIKFKIGDIVETVYLHWKTKKIEQGILLFTENTPLWENMTTIQYTANEFRWLDKELKCLE